MAKLCSTCSEAVSDVASGICMMVGGFGICGSPESLLAALAESSSRLTVIAGTGGSPDAGLGRLIARQRVARLVSTYIGANSDIYKRHVRGQLELELVPQGTFVERIRAGGSGIAAFYTRTGVGTAVASGGVPVRYAADGSGHVIEATPAKETRCFNGVEHVLETALKADFALVKAWRADRSGNLQFRLAASNFNAVMCQAAAVTIAEVEELVDCGQIPPDQIHVPSVFVQRLVLTEAPVTAGVAAAAVAKRVQKRTTLLSRQISLEQPSNKKILTIARRVAVEFQPNACVNLGLGIPMMAASCLPRGLESVRLHSENGILGLGPYPLTEAQIDPDLINASRESVTLRPGAACFDSVTSFAIISGGHLSMTVLGATQVSQFGDLANWIIPGVAAVGMGGAMELASCGIRVVVAMRHCTRDGRPKILATCSLPLTARRCVDLIITELAVFSVDRRGGGLELVELADGVSLGEVAARTGCQFAVSPKLRQMQQQLQDAVYAD